MLDLEQEIVSVQTEVDRLKERNQALEAEVVDLKKGNEAIEERARSEMGMIKKGEIYYQVIGSENTPAEQDQSVE